jgi:hypothetical protein
MCSRQQLGVRQERQDAHVTVDVLIIFYVGSGLELEHIEARSSCPVTAFFHLRNRLAAGAFTGAAGVGGPCLVAASALSFRAWPLVFVSLAW